MIHRVGILIQHSHMIIVKVSLPQQYLFQWEPSFVPVREVEPGASLTMNVENQIEEQFEYLERVLHAIRCIHKANNLGESKDTE